MQISFHKTLCYIFLETVVDIEVLFVFISARGTGIWYHIERYIYIHRFYVNKPPNHVQLTGLLSIFFVELSSSNCML